MRCPLAHFYALNQRSKGAHLPVTLKHISFSKDSNFENDNVLVLGQHQVLTLPHLNKEIGVFY